MGSFVRLIILVCLANLSASATAWSRPVVFAGSDGVGFGYGYIFQLGGKCYVFAPAHVFDSAPMDAHIQIPGVDTVVRFDPDHRLMRANDLDVALRKLADDLNPLLCPQNWFEAGRGATEANAQASLLVYDGEDRAFQRRRIRLRDKGINCVLAESPDTVFIMGTSGLVAEAGAGIVGILSRTSGSRQPIDDVDQACNPIESEDQTDQGGSADQAANPGGGGILASGDGDGGSYAVFIKFSTAQRALLKQIENLPHMEATTRSRRQTHAGLIREAYSLTAQMSLNATALEDMLKALTEYRCSGCTGDNEFQDVEDAIASLSEALIGVSDRGDRERLAAQIETYLTFCEQHPKAVCKRRSHISQELEQIKDAVAEGRDFLLWTALQKDTTLSPYERYQRYSIECGRSTCSRREEAARGIRFAIEDLREPPRFVERYCHERATNPEYRFDPRDKYRGAGKFKGAKLDEIDKTDAQLVEACREASDALPGYGRLPYQLGRVLHAAGRFDEAEKAYRLAESQGELHAHYNLYDLYRVALKGDKRWLPSLLLADSADVLAARLMMARHLILDCALFREHSPADGRYSTEGCDREAMQRLVSLPDNPQASAWLGFMFERGRVGAACEGRECDTEAVRHYRKAMEADVAWAKRNLASMYRRIRGVDDCNNSPKECDVIAFRLYSESASEDAEAQAWQAWMYDRRRGVTCAESECDVEAVRLYRLAADRNQVWAKRNLASMYRQMRGVADCNTSAECDAVALRLYAESAGADAEAQAWQAWMYDARRGVSCGEAECYKEAVRLYRLAGARGQAWATRNLGSMYRTMRGVEDCATQQQCDIIALSLYSESATDNAQARAWQGWMYDNRRGVSCEEAQCIAEAVRLYGLASGRGDGWAGLRLGNMFLRGEAGAACSGETCRQLAEESFRRSAANGNTDASWELLQLFDEQRGEICLENEACRTDVGGHMIDAARDGDPARVVALAKLTSAIALGDNCETNRYCANRFAEVFLAAYRRGDSEERQQLAAALRTAARPAAMAVQDVLRQSGDYKGAIDGAIGNETTAALNAFASRSR